MKYTVAIILLLATLSDATAPPILVNQSNAVLDCRHAAIAGRDVGVRAEDVRNITIRNCRVGLCNVGIQLINVSDSLIENTVVYSNNYRGLQLIDSPNNTLSNITGSGNARYGGYAIELTGASNGNSVERSRLEHNKGENGSNAYGIGIHDGPKFNTVAFSYIVNNQVGIRIERNASNNTVAHNYIAGNERGILLYSGANSTLMYNNTILGNHETGILIRREVGHSVVQENTIHRNYFGVRLVPKDTTGKPHQRPWWNRIIGNDISYNVLDGIQFTGGTDPRNKCGGVRCDIQSNAIENNTIRYNLRGIYMWHASNNTISGNTICGNQQAAVFDADRLNNYYDNECNQSEFCSHECMTNVDIPLINGWNLISIPIRNDIRRPFHEVL